MLDSTGVFNELMYHPVDAAHEWLELRNEMTVDVDLSAWRLDGAVRFTFPDGTLLSGGHTLVVAKAPASLATGTWLSGALGPYEGKLSNSGERLELHNHAGRLMDVVDYDDDAPCWCRSALPFDWPRPTAHRPSEARGLPRATAPHARAGVTQSCRQAFHDIARNPPPSEYPPE